METGRQKRVSGPLLDQIDIHIEEPRVPYATTWRQAAPLYPSFHGALYNLRLAYTQAGRRSPARLAGGRGLPAGQRAVAVDRVVGDELPPSVTAEALPSLPVAPLSSEEATAGRCPMWKMIGIVAGAVVGLVAYPALMTFLTLLAAG